MTLDERFADLRSAMETEIRRVAVEDLLGFIARVRAASSEAERAAAFDDAGRVFAGEPAVLEFLRTLAPPAREEKDVRAQRFARVRVAEIQLYHAAQMKSGRAGADVYRAL